VSAAAPAGLSPFQSRALAIGLLVLAVVSLLALVLVPALLLHRHYDEAIESANDRLVRYKRAAAQAPELTRALEAVREKNGRRFYLRNTAANLASAELSELVKSAIESRGGRITTSQNIAPRDDERFRQVGANVQFFATMANLQKILAALETGEPLVTVSNLTVRPVNAFRGFKPPPGQEPEVVVQVEAFAWAYPDTTRPSGETAAPAPAAKGRGEPS
jgi:hypothetical protein